VLYKHVQRLDGALNFARVRRFGSAGLSTTNENAETVEVDGTGVLDLCMERASEGDVDGKSERRVEEDEASRGDV
jgi:hypothetical protein